LLREIDSQRKKEDPDFKGAFHEKKYKKTPSKAAKNGAKGSSPKNITAKSPKRKKRY
jgi:ATP-dependent RNA helicase RhlE